MCKPKDEGGLGFYSLRVVNNCFIMKLGWQMIENPQKRCVQVLKAKYACGSLPIPSVKSHYRMSHVWRGVVKLWPHVESALIWSTQDGNHVSFWKDNWVLGVGPLEDICQNMFPIENDGALVSSYAHDNGWNWDKIVGLVPGSVRDKIASMKPLVQGRAYAPLWQFAPEGYFSIKTAYAYLLKSHSSSSDNGFQFSQIWMWQGPQRNKTFLWKVAHGRAVTN